MSHIHVEYRESGRGDYSPRSRPAKRRASDAVTPPEASATTCCLTEPDVRLLEQAVAINGGPETPIGRAVAEKLAHAELRRTIPEGYVALNSHVIFRVDGRPPLSRVLVHWDKFYVPGLHLSLHTPWGITLLGMKIGHEAAVYWRDGFAEVIKVESVAHTSNGDARPKEPEQEREKTAAHHSKMPRGLHFE
jgi:hypothetical protein